MPSPPPFPPLTTLRLASPKDLSRIGIVAASGFRYSPVFDWERPYHESYPADTLLSYRHRFAAAIEDPRYVVLVAEDAYRSDEGTMSKVVIPVEDDGVVGMVEGESVVVGVGCWKLKPGSERDGKYQGDGGDFPHLPVNENRDKDLRHSGILMERAGEAEELYFQGYMTLEMVVVHPAYWKRGHGSRLVRWGMELSRMENANHGIMAAKTGVELYKRLGYRHLDDLCIEGDELVPEGVVIAVMEYIVDESGVMAKA